MNRPEIRKINLTQFKQHMGAELKFVTEDRGHLWLCFREKPCAVVIPMRDEALLNELHGRDFADLMHKAQVRASRMVKAAWRAKKYRSEIVEGDDLEIPPFRMTEEQWEANKRYWFQKNGPVG